MGMSSVKIMSLKIKIRLFSLSSFFFLKKEFFIFVKIKIF